MKRETVFKLSVFCFLSVSLLALGFQKASAGPDTRQDAEEGDWGASVLGSNWQIQYGSGDDLVAYTLKFGSRVEATSNGSLAITVFDDPGFMGAVFPKLNEDFPYEYNLVFVYDSQDSEIAGEYLFFDVSGDSLQGIASVEYADGTLGDTYALTGARVPVPSVISTAGDDSVRIVPFRPGQKIDLKIKAEKGRTNWVLLSAVEIPEYRDVVFARSHHDSPPYLRLFAAGGGLVPEAGDLYYSRSPSEDRFDFGENDLYSLGAIWVESVVSATDAPVSMDDMTYVQSLLMVPF